MLVSIVCRCLPCNACVQMHPTIHTAAVACGVDGLFMEVHDDPTTSPVDGPTQWPLRCAALQAAWCEQLAVLHHHMVHAQEGVCTDVCLQGVLVAAQLRLLNTQPDTTSLLAATDPSVLPSAPAVLPPRPRSCRHLRKLLVELLAIARATHGKEELTLDLSPVGDDFDPEAEL